VARPYWLRLFGRNSETTVDGARAALLSSDLGARIADSGRHIEQLFWATALAIPPGARVESNSAPASGSSAAPTGPAPEGDASNLADGDAGRGASLFLNGMAQTLTGTPAFPALAGHDPASKYIVLFSEDIQSALVVDARTKTLLPGGIGDYPDIGVGKGDTLELHGDYSAGFALAVPGFIDQIMMRAGNDYNLIADDSNLAAGGTLTINAMPLRADNHVIFDGSAETDGRFVFFGSDAGDVFLGGAGDDRILGLGGADILGGGGGRDTFVYTGAAESSGADFDTLADFDPASDRIDLIGTVSSFDGAITAGALSMASFDADLGALMGGLGPSQAVWFAPDSGDLAGQIFLVVDANGIAGYQAGEDYVFAVAGAPLADLSGQTGFFI